jgi:hypothetical protein
MSGTKIKIYMSMLYLFFSSLPTFFVLIGTGYGVPIAIIHMIISAMIFLWFVMYELS